MGRRTISNRWPASASLEDYVASCDLCGVLWRRSQLVLDGRGMTVCPEHGSGADSFTLSMENQEAAEAWAQELASRPPRDRGGEYGPQEIARDPREIFAGLTVLFDADPVAAVPAASGFVESLPDANGGAATMTPNGGYAGLRYTLQDWTFGGYPTLGVESTGTTGHTMRTTAVSSALPVTYWGVLKVHKWIAGSALIRSNANAGVFATGTAAQTFTVRSGSTTATEVAGPGQEAWFRFYVTFQANSATWRVGDATATADAGAVALSSLLDFIAMPGGGNGPQWRIGRFLAMAGLPTSAMLEEADTWALSRTSGRLIAL